MLFEFILTFVSMVGSCASIVEENLLGKDTSVEVRLVGKHGHIVTIVSKSDYERVMKYSWCKRGKYASSQEVGALHSFIIGERPLHIPETWIVDHANGNKLDNTKGNLRWASPSFNAWNTPTKESTSIYRGVSWDKQAKRWIARFARKHLGYFKDERLAGRCAAKAAIKVYGEMAATNRLILGPGLFSLEEVYEIQQELLYEKDKVEVVRSLPRGVTFLRKKNKYVARYQKKYIGIYLTLGEALDAYTNHVSDIEAKEWLEHLSIPIQRDSEGHAVIPLTGKGNYFTKVPCKYWHLLTFKHNWWFDREYAVGFWGNKQTSLHSVVYSLIKPEYKQSRHNQVDHVIPELKLDNRECNLRDSTISNQARNKCKRKGAVGKYTGVHFDKSSERWYGCVRIDGKRYRTRQVVSEDEAAKLLNALRIKHLGPNTPLLIIA